MDLFGVNPTDSTQFHMTRAKKPGSCPKCQRKAGKFSAFLGKRFDNGKCPNCQPAQQSAAPTPMTMPLSAIPSTLMVPSPYCHDVPWRGDDQHDDNMTIISEITMDRALLSDTRRPHHLRTSNESSQPASASSSLFTPTPHLMAQDFTTSMDTLTEESDDYRTLRAMHAIARIQEERRVCEQEILTEREESLRRRQDIKRVNDDNQSGSSGQKILDRVTQQKVADQADETLRSRISGEQGVQHVSDEHDSEYEWEEHTHLLQHEGNGRENVLRQQEKISNHSGSSGAGGRIVRGEKERKCHSQLANEIDTSPVRSYSSSKCTPKTGSTSSQSKTMSSRNDESGRFRREKQSSPTFSTSFPSRSPRYEENETRIEQTSKSHNSGDSSGEIQSSKSMSHNETSTASERIMHKQTTQQHTPNQTTVNTQLASITDIPIIIQCIKMHPTQNCIERAFQTLFLLATEADPEGSLARRKILSLGGMELLHAALLQHANSAGAVIALFHALWAMCFFHGSDGESSKDALAKVRELQVLQCILCALKSHCENVKIQDMGFDLIDRFVVAPLPVNQLKLIVSVLPHSLQCVNSNTFILAMHTLNSLCQRSDEIKLEVAQYLTNDKAIIEKLKSKTTTIESRQIIMELLWCITSVLTSVSVLSADSQSIAMDVMIAVEDVPRSRNTASFHESACGTLANFAMLEENHIKMNDVGVVHFLCEEIFAFAFSEYVQAASCTALANLSTSLKLTLLAEDGVNALFFSMKSSPDSVDVQSEALRALLNLCQESPAAFASGIDIIISTLYCHSNVKCIQQVTCSILCKLSTNEKCRISMIRSSGTFDAMIKIQKGNLNDESIQKNALCLLRNLAFERSIIPIILSRGFVQVILEAMDSFPNSVQLQENACHIFLILGFNSEAKVQICSSGGINHIVKTMQVIPESSSLQEATCKALYALIDDSEVYKKIAISLGVVDAVICLILVHPHHLTVLEEAINVLRSLTVVKDCVVQMAGSGGISAVVDAMRSNISSVDLIISASRFIKNMVLQHAEYANAAAGSVIPILSCMNRHPESKQLMVVCCDVLKSLVTQSETCKERLLAANGRNILEQIITEKKYADAATSKQPQSTASATVSVHALLDELC
ncbi:hypothetical protein HJC23_005666 [Cyclotella cryptica]|uniref:Uncharacterized protein n=1 Tax=Cyclotella cryptica TaxID=29204 RepID=A0ABD3PE09_9STRA|eukprot:CCRYP_015527-RA/>CCRYP_015527-RA protein AED:0.01 eAED:0.01 QI:259/1/1/1/1/1/2/258/1127